MNRTEFYNSLKVGDLVLLDPSKVRTSWAKKWANNGWSVEIKRISQNRIDDETTLSGVCVEDRGEGLRQFDANRILSFADNLSKIKQESQRL